MIYGAIRSGALKALKVGRLPRIDQDDLDAWAKGDK
jgi:excisionase family DNA binding protein